MNERFIELFGGIGGFRLGMEPHGFRCAGYYEIDSKCVRQYNRNFGERYEPADIREVGPYTMLRDTEELRVKHIPSRSTAFSVSSPQGNALGSKVSLILSCCLRRTRRRIISSAMPSLSTSSATSPGG